MKLLMITRKVDDSDALAGFTYNWVKKIGKNLEKLYVVTWQKSDGTGLPNNIEIISLPNNKLTKVFFLKMNLLRLLPRVDGLFCHMNPEYTIISAPIAKIFRKKTVSWYTHKQVNIRRRLLEILTNKIVTASSASFRNPLFPKKVEVINHGIDVDLFKPVDEKNDKTNFDIISVGRISPTKDYESIILAIKKIGAKNIKFKLYGDVILKSQKGYMNSLERMVDSFKLNNQVKFMGWVANRQMPPHYQGADLFINMSGTGSVDKVVLEAMASGCLVLTSNEAFEPILPKELMVEKNNPNALAEKIKWLRDLSENEKIELRHKLRQEVVENHNLDNLAKKIITQFKK
jgi:glycosyltransferase involved in cell wall biosynthesis